MSDQQSTHFSQDRLPVKLEGANNYTTWCTYVKAVLKGQGLHGHITGATQRPVPTASATSTVGSAEVEADTKAVAEWERKDDKAQSIILLGVTPAMLGCIAGDMTARQMWDKLATQCHRKDMATRISLMQQLFSTRLRPADSVDQHIRAMAEIRDRLINIGKPLDDPVAAIALLLSVPAEVPQWEMWLRSHTASAKDPTWDDVSADMRAEASLQQQRDRTLMQASADAAAVVAYAAATKGGRQTTTPRAGRPYCTHCNKQGHVAATCWTLHPDQRKQRQATTEHALAVAVADGEQDAPIPGVGLWHVDSGASSHLTGCRAWFTELHSCAPCTVVAANHGTLTCTQRGTVTLNTERGRIHVRDVLYVPSLGVNLLSVSAIVNAGMRVRFTKGGCRISTSRNKLIVQAVARNNIYSIHAAPQPSESAYSVTAGTSSPLSWVVAHGRMGHLNTRDLQALHDKGMALGTTAPSDGSPADIDHCAGCLAGKSHRIPFPTQASHRASQPLELVHSDVCGHIREGDKLTPKRYIVTFIDDYSRFTWVAITSNKSGDTLLNQFVRYKVWAERYTGFQVKALRTDGGGEYINDRFTTYLTVMGIQREMSTARTPQQNGVAERANRTIMEAARSMLHASGLPYTFWEHAVMTAVYLRNRSPTKALTDATPYEAWRGEKPDLSHLRVFGCRAYMHLDKTKRNKLQPRSIPVIFVGYATEAKAWLVYDPVASGSKKTHVSRDVTFHESVAGSTLLTAAVSAAAPAAIEGKTSNSSSSLVQPAAELVDAEKPSSIDHVLIVSDTDSDNDNDSDVEPAVLPVQRFVAAEPSAVDSVPVAPVAAASPPVDQPVPLLPAVSQPASLPGLSSASPRKRVSRAERALRELASHNTLGNSERTSAQPPVAGNFVFAFAASTVATEPLSYKEAMRSPYRAQWEQAMREELDSINANHTYTLVPLPAGRRAIGSKWVYKIKRHADGSVDRFKARLVAKGYAQRHGIDFTETFAPVVRFSSLRAILAIAAAKDYEVHQMDVKTAFLNGDLDEDIYMHQPDGHSASSGEQQQLVWKLEKSLYGLKQAGRAWNKTMDAALIGMGFRPTHSDGCVYVMRDDSSVMYLLVYVDDLLLVASDSAQLTSVKAQLSSRFEMKDMGEAQFILGVQITRDRARRRLYLSQAEYIRTVLERFDMLECKPAASPMATGVKLLKTQLASGASGSIDSTVMDSTPYASAVGALMYAALVTRPDIAFAVTSLCQFMSAPSLSHWQAAKRVMRYLQGTRHRELAYGWAGGQDKQLYGYSDSDWGNDVNDRRSFTGWVFLLHDSAVSWQSCKQPTVALSSTEAEYMAATQATREAVWWRSFMTELGYRPSAATTVHSDSQGAIALSINPEHHKRTKHIDIQHHYVREQVEAGSVVLPHIGTELMVADVLTKPLSAERHTELTGKMGVRAAHNAV